MGESGRVRTEETDLTRRNRYPRPARKQRRGTAWESPSSTARPRAVAPDGAASPRLSSRPRSRSRSAEPRRTRRRHSAAGICGGSGRLRMQWRVTTLATPWLIGGGRIRFWENYTELLLSEQRRVNPTAVDCIRFHSFRLRSAAAHNTLRRCVRWLDYRERLISLIRRWWGGYVVEESEGQRGRERYGVNMIFEWWGPSYPHWKANKLRGRVGIDLEGLSFLFQ